MMKQYEKGLTLILLIALGCVLPSCSTFRLYRPPSLPDNTPPTLSVTVSAPVCVRGEGRVSASWLAIDNVSHVSELEYRYRFGDDEWSGWGSFTSAHFENLVSGSYQLLVQARDKAGNVVERASVFDVSCHEDFTTSCNSTIADWQSSGVFVNAGDEISISASGVVQYLLAPDGNADFCGPEGVGGDTFDNCYLAPGLPRHSLVAVVGGGFPFYVGGSITRVADSSGQLLLGMNDTVRCGGCADNSGTWSVYISVLRTQIPEQ